jgi:hypothetical protein
MGVVAWIKDDKLYVHGTKYFPISIDNHKSKIAWFLHNTEVNIYRLRQRLKDRKRRHITIHHKILPFFRACRKGNRQCGDTLYKIVMRKLFKIYL